MFWKVLCGVQHPVKYFSNFYNFSLEVYQLFNNKYYQNHNDGRYCFINFRWRNLNDLSINCELSNNLFSVYYFLNCLLEAYSTNIKYWLKILYYVCLFLTSFYLRTQFKVLFLNHVLISSWKKYIYILFNWNFKVYF